MGRLYIPLIFTLGLFLISCGGGGGNPVAPELSSRAQVVQNENSRILWGMWDVTLIPTGVDSASVELVPLRGANFNANVQQFLTPPFSPVDLLTFAFEGGTNFPEGYVEVKVAIGHPFPGLPQYRGFDVRCIFMADSDTTGIHDTSISYASPDPYGNPSSVPYLVNPDGYTRWWNPPEFTDPMPLLSYKPSILGTDSAPTSTLNAYKYFADEICCDDDVTMLQTENRGTFSASGGVNTRIIEIQFPTNPLQFKFNLAVDASWALPDPSGAPDYPVDSFPPDAQMQEPYIVLGEQTGGDVFYTDIASGGTIEMSVTVFDWQAYGNPSGVAGEITSIWLEGEPLAAPVDVLPLSHAHPGQNPDTSSVYTFELDNSLLDLQSSGEKMLLGTVTSANPVSYVPQLDGGENFVYPDAPLAAYFLAQVSISDVVPGFTLEIPNGGEAWSVGTNHAIMWSGGDPFNTVKLEYSKDDFVSDIIEIVDAAQNTGSYMWEGIPDDMSDTVKVRVSSVDYPEVYDDSDEYFSIIEEMLQRIVFRGDGPYAGMQIYSIDPEGLTEPEQWTFYDGGAFQECAKLSPCGKYIMYTFCNLAVGEIHLIEVATGIDTDITPEGHEALYSDFSNDGTKIVAAMAPVWYGPHDLYTFDYTGGNVESLTTGADTWAPQFNFDDSKIYFMEFMTSEVRIYDVDSGNITHYTDNGAWNDNPTGSPDGTQIAWATSYPNSGGRVIWISPIDSWNPADLIINFEAYIRSPDFSPDGSKLVFDHGGFDASEIGIWDFDTGTWLDITNNVWGEFQCDWGIMVPH